MKERPILFSAEMMRAILDGRKTQTRRPVKPQPDPKRIKEPVNVDGQWCWRNGWDGSLDGKFDCPYGVPGDRLWVRETWCYATESLGVCPATAYRADGAVKYHKFEDATIPDGTEMFNAMHSDWPDNVTRWRPSIHMPRWASRVTLEITDVRVESIQDISDDDCVAEGVDRNPKSDDGRITCGRPLGTFIDCVWNPIYADKGMGWDANPWVWVIEFKRI